MFNKTEQGKVCDHTQHTLQPGRLKQNTNQVGSNCCNERKMSGWGCHNSLHCSKHKEDKENTGNFNETITQTTGLHNNIYRNIKQL